MLKSPFVIAEVILFSICGSETKEACCHHSVRFNSSSVSVAVTHHVLGRRVTLQCSRMEQSSAFSFTLFNSLSQHETNSQAILSEWVALIDSKTIQPSALLLVHSNSMFVLIAVAELSERFEVFVSGEKYKRTKRESNTGSMTA
jgi:hypothetical protein